MMLLSHSIQIFFERQQHSQRARHIGWRMLEMSTTASLSALLLGSVAALVSPSQPATATRASTWTTTTTTTKISFWLGKLNTIVRSCVNEAQQRRWKGVIAMLVLFYFGKQQRRQQPQRQGLRRRNY
jgi:hypothetical protein